MPEKDLYHLYEVEHPYNKSVQAMSGASASFANMSKGSKQTTETDDGGKSATDALMMGGAGAMLGAELMGGGSLLTTAGALSATGWGAVVAGGLMLGAYLLS